MLNTTERLETKEQALHQVDRTKKYISGARKFLGEEKIGLAIERYAMETFKWWSNSRRIWSDLCSRVNENSFI